MEKYILDVCCGTRMWWKQKKHPNTIYMDIRKEPKEFISEQKNTHMTHIEDKVLYGGVDGTRQAILALRSFRSLLLPLIMSRKASKCLFSL